jgi:hypothetical protein
MKSVVKSLKSNTNSCVDILANKGVSRHLPKIFGGKWNSANVV